MNGEIAFPKCRSYSDFSSIWALGESSKHSWNLLFLYKKNNNYPIESNEISWAQVESSLPASYNQVHIQIGTLTEPDRLALKLNKPLD